MVPWSWSYMADCKYPRRPTQLMENSSTRSRKSDNFLQGHNFPPGFVLSVVFLLISLCSASALPLSQSDSPDIVRLLPNNEVIQYNSKWNKRSGGGSVNFSPGWGKRSNNFEQIHPDGSIKKREVNFSPGWGKRSGGSVNFSPGWGKRSGGSVNFSPGWGKRSVNFSPSWGKRSVNFSPSWGKRSVNFSPSWGKRSGGSVNFSPGWGKRSVNFSPSWGKRGEVASEGLNNYLEDEISRNEGMIFIYLQDEYIPKQYFR